MEEASKILEANKKIARQMTKAFEENDLDTIKSLCDKDKYKLHFPGVPEPMNYEEAMKNNEEFSKGFPDTKILVDLVVAEGDLVSVHSSYKGTHTGEFRGMAPTNKEVEVNGVSIYKIENGKVVEEWDEFDALEMMEQIGAIAEHEHA